MTRLTNNMRERITRKVLQHRFSPKVEELRKWMETLAENVWKDIFKKDMNDIQALPNGWLPTQHCIQVSFAVRTFQLNFNGYNFDRYGSIANLCGITRPMHVERRFLGRCFGQHRTLTTYDAHHTFTVEYDAIEGATKDLEEQISVASKQTLSALGKFFTVEKLLEQWPEIEPFTKDVVPEPPKKLPAIPIMQLNELLDLPVDEAVK